MGRSQVLYNRTKGRFRNRNGDGNGGRGRGGGGRGEEGRGGGGNTTYATQEKEQQKQKQQPKFTSLAQRSQQEFRGRSINKTSSSSQNNVSAGASSEDPEQFHRPQNHRQPTTKSSSKYDETTVMMLADNPQPSSSYYQEAYDYDYENNNNNTPLSMSGSLNIPSLAATFETSMSKSKRLCIPDHIIGIVFRSSSSSTATTSRMRIKGVLEVDEEGSSNDVVEGRTYYDNDNKKTTTISTSISDSPDDDDRYKMNNDSSNNSHNVKNNSIKERSYHAIDFIDNLTSIAATTITAAASVKLHDVTVESNLTDTNIKSKTNNSESGGSSNTVNRKNCHAAPSAAVVVSNDYHDDARSVTLAGTRHRATIVSEGIEVGPPRQRPKDTDDDNDEELALDEWLDGAVILQSTPTVRGPKPKPEIGIGRNQPQERLIQQEKEKARNIIPSSHELQLGARNYGYQQENEASGPTRPMKYRPGRGFTNMIGSGRTGAASADRGRTFSSNPYGTVPSSSTTVSSITTKDSVTTTTSESQANELYADGGDLVDASGGKFHHGNDGPPNRYQTMVGALGSGECNDNGREVHDKPSVDSHGQTFQDSLHYRGPTQKPPGTEGRYVAVRTGRHDGHTGQQSTNSRRQQQYDLQHVQPQMSSNTDRVKQVSSGTYKTTRGVPIATDGEDLDEWLDSVIE